MNKAVSKIKTTFIYDWRVANEGDFYYSEEGTDLNNGHSLSHSLTLSFI